MPFSVLLRVALLDIRDHPPTAAERILNFKMWYYYCLNKYRFASTWSPVAATKCKNKCEKFSERNEREKIFKNFRHFCLVSYSTFSVARGRGGVEWKIAQTQLQTLQKQQQDQHEQRREIICRFSNIFFHFFILYWNFCLAQRWRRRNLLLIQYSTGGR